MHKIKTYRSYSKNVQLIQNLTCVLRMQRTYNLIIRFSKYVIIYIYILEPVIIFILLGKVVT